MALAALALLLLNRNSYPAPWFDEGMFLAGSDAEPNWLLHGHR